MTKRLGPGAAPVSTDVERLNALQKEAELNTASSFDIFLWEADGNFKWVATTESLALARENVIQNPASSDYAFLIVNSATKEKMLIEPLERPPIE